MVALLATGCSKEDVPTFAVDEVASDGAARILNLWQGSWVAALVVGGIVWGLILWSVIFHRRRTPDQVPEQTRYNVPIEVLYTVAPIIAIAVIFAFTARDQSELTKLSENPDNTIQVVGFRWNWTFNYLDEERYEIGEPGEMPTLYLPQGETVRFELVSPDVIHSFWIPAFLFKMDMIPGRTNEFEVTPTKLGTFAGRCAELCGVDHARMLFQVKVVSPEDYDKHMVELGERGQTGILETGRLSDAADAGQGRTTIGSDR